MPSFEEMGSLLDTFLEMPGAKIKYQSNVKALKAKVSKPIKAKYEAPKYVIEPEISTEAIYKMVGNESNNWPNLKKHYCGVWKNASTQNTRVEIDYKM